MRKENLKGGRISGKKTGYQCAVKVKVVGVGGGGGNAVSRMSDDFVRGVEFIAVNTDLQDLELCHVRKKIHIGKNLTGGLGAGMNPEMGARSVEENKNEIVEALSGADLIFLTAGFGGGTGTGALPVVAEIAKENGILTVAVITKPFSFEGVQRSRIAQEGIVKLRDKVDALIVIPNDRIFSIINKDTPIVKAFLEIDEVLKNAVQGIVDLIVTPGIINVDFADVKTVMQNAGSAIVGVGVAGGQERAIDAVRQAINSPLLEVSADGAKGVLFGVSGGRDLKMTEINEAAKIITEAVDPSAKIIFGAYYDKKLKLGQIKVTVIATGFSDARPALGSLFSSGSILSAGMSGRATDTTKKEGSFLTIETEKKEEFLPFSTEKRNSSGSGISKEKEEKRSESVWDIPTFLRRKKK